MAMAPRPGEYRTWTQDWPHAQKLAREGATVEFIASSLNRSVDQVIWKFNKEGKRLPPRAPKGKPGPKPGSSCAEKSHPVESMAQRLNPAQVAERDARYFASLQRTPTQAFFGDPPPGFSALDRKRQEARS